MAQKYRERMAAEGTPEKAWATMAGPPMYSDVGLGGGDESWGAMPKRFDLKRWQRDYGHLLPEETIQQYADPSYKGPFVTPREMGTIPFDAPEWAELRERLGPAPVETGEPMDLTWRLLKEVKSDLTLPVGKEMILQADDKKHSRGLLVELLKDKSYDIAYWYGDEAKPYPIEVLVDGKSVSKDAKRVTMKFHPELKKSSEPMDLAMRLLKENNFFDNMRAKRKRGEKPAKPGDEDYPSKDQWKDITAKSKKPDPRLKAAGVSGYNKPKRTPNHPKKSHVVVARSGGKAKTIRFGQQGKSGAGANPKTKKEKARQKSFKARHAKNIKRGPMSAAYWADKVKW